MGRLRGGERVRIGAPDPSLTAVSGMAAVSELCVQLGVVGVGQRGGPDQAAGSGVFDG